MISKKINELTAVYLAIALTTIVGAFVVLVPSIKSHIVYDSPAQKGNPNTNIADGRIGEDEYNEINSDEMKLSLEKKSPHKVRGILADLYRSNILRNQIVAADLSRYFGVRYRHVPLILQSARFHLAEPIHDLEKTLEVLNENLLANEPLADYYRGLVWSDKEKSGRDLEKAYAYLTKANRAGVGQATRMLAILEKQDPRLSSQQK